MFKNRECLVTNCEKKFLIKCLGEYSRLDGRAFDEFRRLQIDFGKDWGCCHVSLGATKVLAQVSCEVQQPKSSRPSEGILNINLELNPIAAPNFEAGRQSDLSVQLNRLLEKCIKDSKAVDLESLCIKTSEKVWAFRVDLNVLNHDGNIIDCASVAALSALAHFRRPDVTCDGEDFVIHSFRERDPIPTVVHHYPVCVTYTIFHDGEYILADSSLLEENVADATLTVGLNSYRELCGLHLGGNAQLTPNLILATTTKAAKRACSVVEQIKQVLEEDQQKREKKEPIGFLNTLQFNEDFNVTREKFAKYLDEWTITKSKKKALKQKPPKRAAEEIATVESLGANSAALIPNESTAETVWNISSEEESSESNSKDDVIMTGVQKPREEKKGEKTGEDMVIDLDSEEESVIILNVEEKHE